VYRRNGKLVVRADVPGLRKDDVSVEVQGDELCISGERRLESEQTGREYYRAERSYGSFCRTIRLPDGAKVDTASATFQNGVLEVEIEVPAEAPQGRRIEVREQPSH
jgi:HSP20 family protein